MNAADNRPDPTADYRKYPKGPNFLMIVVLASIVILVVLAAAVLLINRKGKTLEPHPPNPTPNSLVQPWLPDTGLSRLS